MEILVKYFIIRVVIIAIWPTTVSSKEQDVCFWNTLDATCEENEVIHMEHALYGRMSVGQCIPEDAGYSLGCQEDVLSYLDTVCSGRQSCTLRLPDEHLAAEHQPCPRGLEAYLQLQYKCIPVHASPIPCADDPIPCTGITGLLANSITGRTGQGSSKCPWEVHGSAGQKVRLTLFDYGAGNLPTSEEGDSGVMEHGSRLSERSDICQIYARVTEDHAGSSITLCGGEAREKIVYLSETERVQIAITDPINDQYQAYFLLRYEIIGCLKYIPPEGAVIVRHDNDISVTCPNTGTGWNVVCDGSRWQAQGNVTNCTETSPHMLEVDKPGPPLSTEVRLKGGLTLSQGLVIAFFLSIAILIAVIIMVIGIVVLRRIPVTVIDSTPGYNYKEHVPMLTKDQRAQQSLADSGYTTTVQRHAAVPPGAMTPRGNLRALPLPPTSSFSDSGHCNIHGTVSRDCYPQHSIQATQPFIQPCSSNEWPNSLRRARNNCKPKDHFYHELDPEHTSVNAGPPLHRTESDIKRLGTDVLGASLPDVLSDSSR